MLTLLFSTPYESFQYPSTSDQYNMQHTGFKKMWSLLHQQLSCSLILWSIIYDNLHDIPLSYLVNHLHQSKNIANIVHLSWSINRLVKKYSSIIICQKVDDASSSRTSPTITHHSQYIHKSLWNETIHFSKSSLLSRSSSWIYLDPKGSTLELAAYINEMVER